MTRNTDNVSLLLKIIIYGTFIIGLSFALIGVWLVILGATGETEFSFFGQSFKSVNVGIGSVFIGGAIIVILIRRAFKSIDLGINNSKKEELDTLSEEQIKLLKVISDSGDRGTYPRRIEEAGLGFERKDIIYRCKDLERNGYISIQSFTDYFYKITKKGKDYLREN
jgi:hypothetical protein